MWKSFITLIAIAGWFVVEPALTQEKKKKSLGYDRNVIGRASDSTPRKTPLPTELILQGAPADNRNGNTNRTGNSSRSGNGNNSRGRPDRGKPRDPAGHPVDPLGDSARAAADQMALKMASGYGYREYYRVGFYRGLKQSMEHPPAGNRDYRDGLRQGRGDREAQQEGKHAGATAAREMAAQHAREDVAREFRNLNAEPQLRPGRGMSDMPQFSFAPQWQEPTLELVFTNHPLNRFDGWRARNVRFHNNWSPNPWNLFNKNRWEDVYEDRWRQAGHAIDQWCRNRKNRTWYESLAEPDQNRFRTVFQQTFDQQVNGYFHQQTQPAYDIGFSDGWGYGAYVASEWNFQQGYYESATDVASDSARDSYLRTWPRVYQEHYEEAYYDWKNNPHPEVTHLEIVDGNRDGVLEPGEQFSVVMKAVNYGGTGGRIPLVLASEGVAPGSPIAVRLPPRSQQQIREGNWQVAPHVPSGSTISMNFSLGSYQVMSDSYVSWPLQLKMPDIAFRDNLNGQIALSVDVRNTSTKPINNAVLVMSGERRKLGPIQPDQWARVDFAEISVHPLELLGGRTEFRIGVERDSRVRDNLRFTPPEQVTDLNNSDLTNLFLDLAYASKTNRKYVILAHELMTMRLEADWHKAVAARGNPYKRDLRKNGNETALGQLVQAWSTAKGHAANPHIFTSLQPKLESLAGTFPGAHPFLRKQFRKLSRKLK